MISDPTRYLRMVVERRWNVTFLITPPVYWILWCTGVVGWLDPLGEWTPLLVLGILEGVHFAQEVQTLSDTGIAIFNIPKNQFSNKTIESY